MAIADDFTVAVNGDIRYVGSAHGAATAGYYTVIEFHRWLSDLADDAVASATSSDFLDMSFSTPSNRQTDNIVELISPYNIDQTAAEHLYDGSIIQGGGTDIWDGLVVIANQGMNLQIVQNGARVTNDFWNYGIKGTATGGSTTTMVDSGATFGTNSELVGYYIENTTEGCWGVITSHDNTTITCSAGFEEGTNQDFAATDAYRIVKGLNADVTSGYSHRFMLKVRTSGSDVDGRRLIGQTRVWYKTYSEFRIGTGTARGNNVLALNYSNDLNNSSTVATISAKSISNTTAGYNALDVNADTTDEYFYSEWNVNKPTNSINDLYEYAKWLSRQDSAQTFYGINGELFRGITHELDVDGGTGTWSVTSEAEEITWTGGSGRLLAVDSGANSAASTTTKIWFQLVTGVVPTDNQTITGTTSSATVDADLTTGSLVERPLNFPFIGASTGSALIGAYGVGVETDDLTNNDLLTALDNNVYQPPNNQTFYVVGLYHDEDYCLVGPNSGGGYNTTQMTLSAALTTDNITTVTVGASNIPLDTPSTGYIRVEDNNGVYRRLHYTAWENTGGTFTVDTTDGNEDFASVNADASNGVWVSYIDELAQGTLTTAGSFVNGTEYKIATVGTTDFTLIGAASNTVGVIFTATGAGTGTGTAYTTSATSSFQATYQTDRSLYVRVRDGGVGKGDTPIKTFETAATFGSAGGTSTVIRTNDY